MTVLVSIRARQVLDCGGRPMVEVDIVTAAGATASAGAATGTSVGRHESVVLRDDDPLSYRGMSVLGVVDTVNGRIAPRLIGKEFASQEDFDSFLIEMDGTERKSRLGGNAIYPLSVAFLRAQASEQRVPVYERVARQTLSSLPVPCFNVVNGGRLRDFTQPFNEFLVVPYGAESIAEAVEIGVVVFEQLAKSIEAATGRKPAFAKSQGYAAPSPSPREVLAIMREAVSDAGFEGKVAFALDCAASEIYDAATATYRMHRGPMDSTDLVGYLRGLTDEFDFLFIEDPLDEDDWSGFSLANRELNKTWLLGDDLIATSRSRLERAMREKAVDGFVLKPNQAGTVTEALDCFDVARSHDLIAIPSGRSGGVIDDIVMDLSFGLQSPFQKNGAPRSGERIAKLNFLLRLADSLPDLALCRLESMARW